MVEIKYTPPRSIKQARRRIRNCKRAMRTPQANIGTSVASIEAAATQLVREYPLSAVGIAAATMFLLVRVKWLRETAMLAAVRGVRQYLNAPSPTK